MQVEINGEEKAVLASDGDAVSDRNTILFFCVVIVVAHAVNISQSYSIIDLRNQIEQLQIKEIER